MYFKTSSTGKKAKKKSVKQFYTLTFSYTFTGPDIIYFAHTYPYTYTDLQKYLTVLDGNTKLSSIYHRKLLCNSLGEY